MLPPVGTTPPLQSYIGDIAGNYERISTKFSAVCPLTRVMSTINTSGGMPVRHKTPLGILIFLFFIIIKF